MTTYRSDDGHPNGALRHLPANAEGRIAPAEFEIRIAEDKPTEIIGHAAVFEFESVDFGGWREILSEGAFKDAIPVSDIRSLFNHDPNYVLGRVKSKTLRVREDEVGLFTETTPPETATVRDLVLTPMSRGDIDEASFAFTLKEPLDDWVEWSDKGDYLLRRILPGGVKELFDISPVTYGAYPDTAMGLRADGMMGLAVGMRSFQRLIAADEELRQRHVYLQHERMQRAREMRLAMMADSLDMRTL